MTMDFEVGREDRTGSELCPGWALVLCWTFWFGYQNVVF